MNNEPPTRYYLEHVRENRRITGPGTLAFCQKEYFRQWRDPDGSIPWRIMAALQEIVDKGDEA